MQTLLKQLIFRIKPVKFLEDSFLLEDLLQEAQGLLL